MDCWKKRKKDYVRAWVTVKNVGIGKHIAKSGAELTGGTKTANWYRGFMCVVLDITFIRLEGGGKDINGYNGLKSAPEFVYVSKGRANEIAT